MQQIRHVSLIAAFLMSTAIGAAAAPTFVNSLAIPGDSIDLTELNGQSGGANVNRLSVASDLYYDRSADVYYGMPDRGPGGGALTYEARIQKFKLDVDANTGVISGFNLIDTIRLTNGGANYNGQNPSLLNGSKSTLGLSLDPEGIVVDVKGNIYISDEYGPSVLQFNSNGQFVRAFTTPSNLIPREASSTVNYVDGRPTITTGRQDNRGFEGLTMSPDGSKLYAMLQDPLVNEGTNSGAADGRRSRNLRMIEFDAATGVQTRQFIYRLEALSDINARISPDSEDFGANSQGRNIGISSVTALNDHEFLVIERDNRGVGEADPLGEQDGIGLVGSKRVYKIDISGATDVKGISLDNTNGLNGATPVQKSSSPFIDIQAALAALGLPIPEKIEGLTIGPQLADGDYMILIGTDNDFSVTQPASGPQLDVCVNATMTASETVALDAGCSSGFSPIPTYLYSFRASADELSFQAPIPEPATVGLFGLGLAGLLALRRRRG